ncbi:hypothetical protein Dimus_035496, partial [Dionaea muscipula]
ANVLWSETMRRREEKEEIIQGFIREHETRKTTYERSVKDALEKAKVVVEKLEATKAKAKLNTD